MKQFLFGMLAFSILFPALAFSQTYTTNFDATENPISEGGAWHHACPDFFYARTGNGIAYGTQTAGGYSDSYALLSGFPADHTAWAVVHVQRPIPNDGHTHEAEILLRFTDSPTTARGYECLFDQGGGVQLVRWNGAMGDFTVLNPVEYGSASTINDGDTLKASIVGNVITMYRNGVKRAQLTDNSVQTGNPGMSFCCGTLATNAYYGFTSYTAVGGNGTGVDSRISIPKQSSLKPNTPNPFKSSTDLAYDLSAPDHVTLKVYDMLGREISTLVNGNKGAGSHTVRFDGSAFTEGVFTARLITGNTVQTRKMLLMK